MKRCDRPAQAKGWSPSPLPLPVCMALGELNGKHPAPDEEVVLNQRIFQESFLCLFEDPLKPLLTNQLLNRLSCDFFPVQVKFRCHGVFLLCFCCVYITVASEI